LDTRSKIIPFQEARELLRDKPARWVWGHFDPLLAEHVRRLRKSNPEGGLLVVEVTNPPRPILPQQARAELVAALRVVDYVVLGDGVRTSPDAADSGLTERFIDQVVRRHRGKGEG
jgi:glycerol-3-phosphate cytidylyltransferase-like family protein